MPLVKAICTNCGANLEVDNSKDAAICPMCGTPYIVEKAINLIVENGNGVHSSIESAKRMIAIGEYEKAEKMLSKVTDNHPDNGTAWMLLAQNALRQGMALFNEGHLALYAKTANEVIKYFENWDRHCEEKGPVTIESVNASFPLACLTRFPKYKNMIIKLLGETTYGKAIEEELQLLTNVFSQSEKVLRALTADQLVGLESYMGSSLYDDLREVAFFLYDKQVMLYDGNYYHIVSVNNGLINLEEHFSHFPEKKQYKILYVVKNHFVLSPCITHKEVYMFSKDGLKIGVGNRIDYGLMVEKKLESRKAQKECPICGKRLSLFGKCRFTSN